MTKNEVKFLRHLHLMIFENDLDVKIFTANRSFPDLAAEARNCRSLEYSQRKKAILEEVLNVFIKNIID